MSRTSTRDLAAAVDLGSNSFHMVVARTREGRIQIIDRLRERVRIGDGLAADGKLAPAAVARAEECLRRFAQRLAGVPASRVRAVATDTFRRTVKPADLRRRAERALGHPIEVVAGHEEARLAYLGVRHDLGDWGERLLVVDVGGGSTEIVAGTGREPEAGESLSMGTLRWSRDFFTDGEISAKRLRRARLAALHELEPVAGAFRRIDAERWIGSSGTALSLALMLREGGIDYEGLTSDGLDELTDQVLRWRYLDQVDLPGLEEGRRPTLLGGLAIFTAVLEALRIPRLETSEGSLREGALLDLVGRLQHRGDPRRRAVDDLARRCEVDPAQAARVRATAGELFAAVRAAWRLDEREHLPLLEWAATLHEAGQFVGHNGFHRHGRYLVENADLPGFSRTESAELAWLVWKHRRTLPRSHVTEAPGARREVLMRLVILLRLAARLHRARGATPPPRLRAVATTGGLRLRFPSRWLAKHPLTAFDLEEEAGDWQGVGLRLHFA
jgi:exopolyphosphatase/guanosine-5'-triphosphate,3'-diphosphate pyrophosphatase